VKSTPFVDQENYSNLHEDAQAKWEQAVNTNLDLDNYNGPGPTACGGFAVKLLGTMVGRLT
jgi:hypothetical protein